MNHWNDRKVAVVGLGRTGLDVTRFLRGLGARVSTTDDAPLDRIRGAIEAVESLGASFHPASQRNDLWDNAALCVSSPGVPWHAPVLEEARSRGIEVVSELELSARFVQGTLIAITGTNGKSTTTELLAHLLRSCGLPAIAGGNLGRPLCHMLEEDAASMHHVVECSSFQLQGCTAFRPHVAVFLNFSPNHLDHHASLDEYLRAKMRIFQSQGPEDYAVCNIEDPAVREHTRTLRARPIPYGVGNAARAAATGLWLQDGQIWTAFGDGPRAWLETETIPLPGAHNVENVMAAGAAALALGCPMDRLREAVTDFRALAHRQEPVAEVRGVRFVDDSKATNVEAVRTAVRAFPEGVHLILGGRDKGGDWESLRPDVQAHVRGLYLIGESAGLIAQALEGSAPMQMCGTMKDAVETAWDAANQGETVLLSPGCASFDMFRDYAHRGEVFAEAARELESSGLTACNGGAK